MSIEEQEQGVATVETSDGEQYWIAIVDRDGKRHVHLMKGDPNIGEEQHLYTYTETAQMTKRGTAEAIIDRLDAYLDTRHAYETQEEPDVTWDEVLEAKDALIVLIARL